jgi:hypothetical protein
MCCTAFHPPPNVAAAVMLLVPTTEATWLMGAGVRCDSDGCSVSGTATLNFRMKAADAELADAVKHNHATAQQGFFRSLLLPRCAVYTCNCLKLAWAPLTPAHRGPPHRSRSLSATSFPLHRSRSLSATSFPLR